MLDIENLFQKQNNTQPSQSPKIDKKKILIIEDELYIVDIYKQVLTEHGYKIDVASNGEEGLRKITEISPNLIFLDLRMPVMDGKTMLAHLKNDSEYTQFKKIPVVVLTNSGTTENIRTLITLGEANEFIIKSNITPDEIVKIAQKYLY